MKGSCNPLMMNHMRSASLVYISGKMAWKPFLHQVERAKDILGLIHTDVCGPFRTMSREGASYFITFTDEFSRYSFVYLMKDKHEVFETFKVFQNEVENLLGKKIKAIQSDRGGEYLSHEFVNYMKSCGIIVPTEVESQNVGVPIHRSARIPQVPDRYGNYVDIEEYEIGDIDEPPNYKAALADLESDKWLEAMNMEMILSKSNLLDFLVLYVDDILLMRNSIAMLQEVKSWLCKCFSIKDLGEAAYILGIKIIRNRPKRLIALSKSAYLEKTLKKFRMENSNKRFNNVCVKTILKYLRNTKDMVLVYGAKPEDELKKSAKQSTNVMSSIEDEYIDAAEPLMEAIWMRKFINGLGDVMPSNKRPMEMLCDNEPALAIARDPKILKGARNFQRKYQYIHKVIQRGEIVLKKVHTYDNVVDPFTKPMSLNKHFEHAMSIGIVPASSLI
ncbi:retrotransposon protein, putative, ty1-copia subclass [Tanacetum coccineum]